MMMHIIEGRSVNLRGLSMEDLDSLITATHQRLERVNEELESVCGEKLRRQAGIDIGPSLKFDLPQPHSWDPSAA